MLNLMHNLQKRLFKNLADQISSGLPMKVNEESYGKQDTMLIGRTSTSIQENASSALTWQYRYLNWQKPFKFVIPFLASTNFHLASLAMSLMATFIA